MILNNSSLCVKYRIYMKSSLWMSALFKYNRIIELGRIPFWIPSRSSLNLGRIHRDSKFCKSIYDIEVELVGKVIFFLHQSGIRVGYGH